MGKARFLAALALACASLAFPARAVPLLGSLDVVLAWTPPYPAPHQNVTFIGSASDNDGTVISATMCFGDGSSCSTITEPSDSVDHIRACLLGDNWSREWLKKYTRTGTFRASLTVTTKGCPPAPNETETLSVNITVR